MDLEAILKQLREEREQLEVSILAMERLQIGHGPRRGRPPAWLSAIKLSGIKSSGIKLASVTTAAPGAPKKRGRPTGSKKKNQVEGS
jgi:hypothetical protein